MNLINTCSLHTLFCLMVASCLMLTTSSCEDDDGTLGGIDGPAGTECRNDSNCPGESVCNNGHCECLDQDAQLAPGFCVQTSYANTFATFDTTLSCIDTTLIAFLDDPFSLTWPQGTESQQISSYVYNRDPNGTVPGSVGAAVALRPNDSNTGVDSIYITRILGPDGDYCSCESWKCKNSFYGAFVGRDTIRGVLQFIGCNDSNSGEPIPDAFMETYPMTFVRLN